MHHFKILIVVFVLLGCTNSKNVTGTSDLEVAQMRWSRAAISDYEFTQSISCYCTEEYRRPKVIVVRGGVIESVDDTQFVDNDMSYKTIPDFFDYISQTLNSNPAVSQVLYDNRYGFPRKIYFDLDERIADDEIEYSLSNFKILD